MSPIGKGDILIIKRYNILLLSLQVYVSEIAHPEIRGCLSAVLKMAGHLGTLSSFTLGAFLDWRQLATGKKMMVVVHCHW